MPGFGMPWTRAGLILCLLILSGCVARAPIHPPVELCPEDRPAIVDHESQITPEGSWWLSACINAGRNNCRALKAIRGEDVDQCDQGLR